MRAHVISTTLLAFCVLILIAGCDTSEDPNLLNPPLPDSTRVRVINALPGEPVSLALAGREVTADLPPLFVSPFRQFLFLDRITVTAQRGARIDSLRDQILSKNAIVTYFVLGTEDTTHIVVKTTTDDIREDLIELNEGRLIFINTIADSSYIIRRGCRSGDTLFSSVAPFQSSISLDFKESDLSLYLFNSLDSVLLSTARLPITSGSVSYLIAALENGTPKLYVLTAGSDISAAQPLTEAPPETRNTAQVQLLNGLDGSSVSVALLGTPGTIVDNLAPGALSTSTQVEACLNPAGDSLIIITETDDSLRTAMRLDVGSNSLVALYTENAISKALVLDRNVSGGASEKIYMRGVNLSDNAQSVSLAIGAGAPVGVPDGLRPFGTLTTGLPSGYIELPEGLFPLILRRSSTGEFLDGGVQNFTAGYYTLLIMDSTGIPVLRMLQDDVPDTQPAALDNPGQSVLFFNMMPDQLAQFEAQTNNGTIVVDSLAYSYVATTILPFDVTDITGNGLGTIPVDLQQSGYTIGATLVDGNREVLALNTPDVNSSFDKASVRFLNAASKSDIELHIGSNTDPAFTTLPFGIASDNVELEERKFSFSVTRPGDTAQIALITGLELSGGYQYLLIIGPRGATSSSTLEYGTLWMQE